MAANGLNSADLTRAQMPEKIVTLLLLFVLLTAATAGVTSVLISPDWGSLWRGLIFGLLIGWVLAIFQQPPWRSALIAASLGTSYALLYAGGLRQKVSAVLTELIFIMSRITISPQDPGVDFNSVTLLLAESFNTTGVIIERVRMWGVSLVVGEPTFDPVAATFVWIMLVWIIAAWAGWVAIAHKNGLLAVLPALLLSVGTLSFGRRESFTLYLMLGTTLLLLATVQHARREQEWDEIATAYPPRKGRQVGNTAVIVSVALVLLSAIISSISIPRVLEWVSTHNDPVAQSESGLAESLGIVTGATASPDVFEDVRRPGLPRDLLIGSGPELSKRIVMTVAVKDLFSIFKGEQPQPLYWRNLTYDAYTGHGWRTSDTTTSQYQANQHLQLEHSPQHILVDQVVRRVGDETRNVFAAGEPVSVNHFSDVARRSPGDLFGILISSATSYETRSLISVADERALRAEGQEYPDWVIQRFLSLPPEVPGRVKELALQLTASEPTPYDRVRAIEQYLRTFPYTLDVPYPPLDQDLVDFFLFDLQKGYCDYYASAMVVLARAAGVPARFAIGYANGTFDLNAKRFLVSEADAHSWVEVYFPNAGWVPFEPTAGRPQLEKSKDSASVFESGLTLPKEIPDIDQTNYLPSGWLLLLGFIILLGILGIIWVAFDEIRLHSLSEPAAAIEIYLRMRRFGALLAVTSEPGDTPYEFAISLNSKLQEISQIVVTPVFVQRLFEEISTMIDKIVETSYRPSHYQDKYGNLIIQQWKGLRWRLRLMWLINYFQSFRFRLRGTLVGAVHDNSEVIEEEE